MNQRYDQIEDFPALRERLLGDALLFSAIVVTPGVALSVARFVVIGWKPVMGVHIAILAALWMGCILRHHLSYGMKAAVLLGTQIVAIHTALAQFGPAGGAQAFAVIMAFVAMVFVNPRTAWALVAGNTIGIAILGYAAAQHWLAFDFDFQAYANHPLVWLNIVWMLGSYGTLLAYITWRMVTHLLARQKVVEKLLEQRQLDLRRTEEMRQRLAATLENTPHVAVRWFTREGYIAYWNPAAETLYGWGAREVIGRPLEEFLGTAEATSLKDCIDHLAAGCSVIGPQEYMHSHQDGSKRIVLSTLYALPGEGQLLFACMDVDITAQKMLEHHLQSAKAVAEEASQAKTTFLASMSHELRNPLNAVIGFAQMLELNAHNLSTDTHREIVGHILQSGRHLQALINDALDLARIESDRLELSLAPVGVAPAIEEAMILVRTQAQARHVSLRQTAEAMLHLRADAARLRQILVNLLSNGVKYNREGGQVVVSARRNGAAVRVTVIDTGIGIPHERSSLLFHAFQRLGAEGSAVDGTGIGLWVSKKLVEAMEGAIGFESEPGIGSRFWIELPAAEPVETSAGGRAALFSADATVRGCVLYVEDNPVNAKVMEHAFQLLPGVELLIAACAEEGIARVNERHPDLVLMDINLPGMTGTEALAALKADPTTASIPVFAVSAVALPEHVQASLQAGFAAYFTKPFNVAEILEAVCKELHGNKHDDTTIPALGSGMGGDPGDVA